MASKKKTNCPPKPKGRPTKYTKELGDYICERLANGESLNAICKGKDMPDERAVRMWALNPDHPFSPSYVRAREIGYLKMADDLSEIADDGSNDWMERTGKDGESVGWTLNGEHVQRSRLRVDTRKWLLSKCLPKVFGDRQVNEISGPDGGPIETKVVADELETARRVGFMLGRVAGKVAAKADGSQRA